MNKAITVAMRTYLNVFQLQSAITAAVTDN